MLHILAGTLFVTTVYPVWYAWRANRRTSLVQAVNWAVSAWTVWGLLVVSTAASSAPQTLLLRHLALCLTGCAGVAVLGARRPGVGAWNFVVFGLLAVLLLPQAEGLLTGAGLHLDTFRTVFLSATLAVGVLNYLPTRMGMAAVLAAVGCGFEIAQLHGMGPFAGRPEQGSPLTALWLALVPWLAYAAVRGQEPPASEFDRLWLGFRDRFGLVWGQRLREQFNNAARHAGWPVVLRWQGLRLFAGEVVPDPDTQTAIVAGLCALMKRFGPAEDSSPLPRGERGAKQASDQ
jgi:hypothetical protein